VVRCVGNVHLFPRADTDGCVFATHPTFTQLETLRFPPGYNHYVGTATRFILGRVPALKPVVIAFVIFASLNSGLSAKAGDLDKEKDAAKVNQEVLSGGNYEVEIVRDLPYVEGPEADPRKHKLDLFLPKGKKSFPVVFFIHGGGWRSGDRKLYGNFGRIFAKNGVGAVIISYRLTPPVTHPAHIEDVAKAFAWTHKNIAKYGGRPDEIFVTGQSAGGHLAALLATNEQYLAAESLSLKSIKGVMPMSGIYLFRPGWMEVVIGKGEKAAESASPLKHVSGKEPPFLILYADRDFPGCDKMSIALNDLLMKNKVESSCGAIKDRNHISIIFKMMFNDADPATQALLKFMAAHSKELKLTPKGG